jgi:hypothetical protein
MVSNHGEHADRMAWWALMQLDDDWPCTHSVTLHKISLGPIRLIRFGRNLRTSFKNGQLHFCKYCNIAFWLLGACTLLDEYYPSQSYKLCRQLLDEIVYSYIKNVQKLSGGNKDS